MVAPETRRFMRKYDRKIERELKRDRKMLFKALGEFANIRENSQGWTHFGKRWPEFFPEEEYKRLAACSKPSILDYPYWLNQIWTGGETEPHLRILLGIDSAPEPVDGMMPEDAWLIGLASIGAKFYADWDQGIFSYEGTCDFQRALFLLFRESWRARVCEKCDSKFIARRAAQKYCSTDCSEDMQRELKQKWWAEHGEKWRKRHKLSAAKRKSGKNGSDKAR
jgi:hypothetical protein